MMQIFIVCMNFFFLQQKKITLFCLGAYMFYIIFSVFFFFLSLNLVTILNPLHTKPAELLFHFSCLSSFHLAAVELGRNHARLFGLAVNSAITHAKTENLTFVISLLLRPICSRQTRREARVEEKEKPVCLFFSSLQRRQHLGFLFVFFSFISIHHAENELIYLYWSAANDILFHKQSC